MSNLDTDRYYDGGDLRGELSPRQVEAIEHRKALDQIVGELDDALQCLHQAADELRHVLQIHTKLVEECVREAQTELQVADRQSLPEDDQIIMGHVRMAEALLGATLKVLSLK